MEVAKDFGTFELSFTRLFHALIDSRVQSLAICQFLLSLGIQLPDFFHELLFLHLETVVFLDKLIEICLKLGSDCVSLTCLTDQSLLFEQVDLSLEFGRDDFYLRF